MRTYNTRNTSAKHSAEINNKWQAESEARLRACRHSSINIIRRCNTCKKRITAVTDETYTWEKEILNCVACYNNK